MAARKKLSTVSIFHKRCDEVYRSLANRVRRLLKRYTRVYSESVNSLRQWQPGGWASPAGVSTL